MTVSARAHGRRVNTQSGRLATQLDDGDPALRRLLEVAVLCNEATLGDKPTATTPATRWSWRCCAPAARRAWTAARCFRASRWSASMPSIPLPASCRPFTTSAGAASPRSRARPRRCWHAPATCSHPTGEQPLDATMLAGWRARIERYGREGLRVLALAAATADESGDFADRLTLLGIVALEDPARAGRARVDRGLPGGRRARGHGHRRPCRDRAQYRPRHRSRRRRFCGFSTGPNSTARPPTLRACSRPTSSRASAPPTSWRSCAPTRPPARSWP